MSVPVQVDNVSEGLSKLISFWKDKPSVQGLLRSILEGVEDLEEVAFQVLNERNIYDAVGEQLDLLGLLVGESRLGRVDEPYRQAILSRVALNAADATPEKILELLKIVTNTENVGIFEHYPANLHLFTDGVVTNSVAKTAEKISAAGVSVRLMFHDPTTPSFIPSSLLGSTFNLVDDNLDNLEDNNLDNFIVNGYSERVVEGNRSYLPNLGETAKVNPLCNVITS